MKKRFFLILTFGMIVLCSCDYNGADFSASSEPDSKTGKQEAEMTSSPNSSEAVYQKISAQEAIEFMNSKDDFIILDVRTEEEFVEKRIDGAVLIPDYELRQRAESELKDKNIRILVYCRSGRRSEAAARELIDMGYKNVYDFGGIIDWKYETIRG